MGAGPGRRAALTERRQRPARTNPDYRDAYLPDDVDLSNPARNELYRRASIDVPGIGDPIGDNDVTIPATRVAWGLTVMNDAPNRGNAVAFVQLLQAPGGVGQESLDTLGPAPISPAIVGRDDWARLPAELKALVTRDDELADSRRDGGRRR